MTNRIYNGVKRLLFGANTFFTVRSGSMPVNGSSFATVYSERLKYPIRIVGVKFIVDPSGQAEWRITINGEKCFPYNEINNLDSEYHSMVPIEVAAGELLAIEARSRNKEYSGIIILEELDIIELR